VVGVLGFVSFVVAIILGVDMGLSDFDNRVERFWQSRPIPVAAYFRKRYALGLVFILAMAALPPLMVYVGAPWGLEWPFARMGHAAYAEKMLLGVREVASEFLFDFVPQAALVYGVAVFLGTLTRRRVMSMVLGLATAPWIVLIGYIISLVPGMGWAVARCAILVIGTAGLGWLAGLSIRGRWRERFDAGLVPMPRVNA
jgi:hypothetical protein